MSEYTVITEVEMDKVLEWDKGWRKVKVIGTHELVYQWQSRSNPAIIIRVLSSIDEKTRIGRENGSDAIRVLAMDRNNKMKWLTKERRVFRVKGWRENLTARVLEALESAKKKFPPS